MKLLHSPSMIWCLLAGVLASAATAQERKATDPPSREPTWQHFSAGTADEWMTTLLESTVDTYSKRVVDRLSYFHLSAAQVRRLKTAAEQETSDAKRVVLWQAIRQSRDIDGRSYLLDTLLNKASDDLRIQFLEQLQNPSRFDLPILVALYNSRQPVQKADAQAPSRSPLKENNNKEANSAQPVARQSLDPTVKVLEFTCGSKWSDSTTSQGSPFPYSSDGPEDLRSKYLATMHMRRVEAQLAQVEMAHWLIKHGLEDDHRILAYQAYILAKPETRATITQHADFARELLKGLEKPESRAKAVPLVTGVTEPSQYLDDEAAIVRLSAIDVMGKHLVQSRDNVSVQGFLEKAELYKPLLQLVQRSDASAEVRVAAKQLQETIAEFEKQDAKRGARAIR